MPVIPLECPSCGIGLRIDSDDKAAICSSCGKPFVVHEAIVQNYIKIVTEMNADKGNTKELVYEEFVVEGDVLKRYNGTSPSVVIPDNVTVIGSKAFEDCREVIEIKISASVKEIGSNAFAGCSNLRTVYFSDSLKKIDSYAFSECNALETLTFPFNIEEIGPYAFSRCLMLASVKMPSSKANIHETAFMGCKDLHFEWPDDWARKQLGKLKIVAPTLGGLISLFDSNGVGTTEGRTFLFLGMAAGFFLLSARSMLTGIL